jgi:hypothetical protein
MRFPCELIWPYGQPAILVLAVSLAIFPVLSACNAAQQKHTVPDDDTEAPDTGVDTGVDTGIEDTDSDSHFEVDPILENWCGTANLCWFKSFGTGEFDAADEVTVLADGSYVVSGRCGVDAVFGAGEPGEIVLGETGYWNGGSFLAKFAQDGTVMTATRLTVDGRVTSIASTPDEGLLIVGHFEGDAVFGEGEPNETLLVSAEYWAGVDEVFLAKYTSELELVWARQDGGTVTTPTALAVLPDTSFVVTGTFEGNPIFGVGDPNQIQLTQNQNLYSQQQFIAVYNHDGVLVWAAADGGEQTGRVIAVAGDGTIATVGRHLHHAVFGMGQPNQTILQAPYGEGYGGFVSVYEQDGTLKWAVNAAGIDVAEFNSASFLEGGAVLIAGQFNFQMEFMDEESPITLPEGGGSPASEVFWARYTSTGQLEWAQSSKTESEWTGSDRGTIAVPLSAGGFLLNTNQREGGVARIGKQPTDWMYVNEWWITTEEDNLRYEPFAAKYDDDGYITWCAHLGLDWHSFRTGSTKLLADGTFLATGGFYEEVDLVIDGEEVTEDATVDELLIPSKDGFLMRVCPVLEE